MNKKGFTPHIDCAYGSFAETVLMPGDPKRSVFIAENFLNGARLVNDVRGVKGYTGSYKGGPVSVMASGMGMPSIGIYSYELYNHFGVEKIIRVGSAGAYQENIKLKDIIIAEGACTDSSFVNQFRLNGSFAPIASFSLLKGCADSAEELKLPYHIGNVFSTDVFYGDLEQLPRNQLPISLWSKMGVLAVEMEAAALYMTAARYGKKALAICTVSDSLVTGEELPPEERATGFNQMITLALETAIK